MAPTVFSALQRAAGTYFVNTKKYASQPSVKAYLHLLSPLRLVSLFISVVYIFLQGIIVLLFKPPRPKNAHKPLRNPRGSIAIIGTGLSGVSSAAHAIAHGFEVTLYEADSPEKGMGGIWANVNSTSGLQLNSLLYRFWPGVIWSEAFPKRDEIVGEIEQIWKEYGLESRTRFNTKVTSVRRVGPSQEERELDNPETARVAKKDPSARKKTPPRSQWAINNNTSEIYDAVIVCVGTCGKPKVVKIDGMPDNFDYGSLDNLEPSSNSSETSDGEPKKEGSKGPFPNPIIHSSALDVLTGDKLSKFKNIVVIGSGASGVEACETLLQKIEEVSGSQSKKDKTSISMIARSDKWIIPRNIVIDTMISAQPFGKEMPLSFIPEFFIRKFHYRSAEWLAPDRRAGGKGLFEGTPVVNDEFLKHVRAGSIKYIQGSPEALTESGKVKVQTRKGKKEEELIDADLVIMATGFERPSTDFLTCDDKTDLFPEGYERPNLYLQVFCTQDWSILMTNSSYLNAIGTVGHFHIGIYARILMTLLLEPKTRPSPKDMKLWVDAISYVKRGASGGAFFFFTYAELTLWLLAFHVFRPDRIRWIFFIMQGWGLGIQE